VTVLGSSSRVHNGFSLNCEWPALSVVAQCALRRVAVLVKNQLRRPALGIGHERDLCINNLRGVEYERNGTSYARAYLCIGALDPFFDL
jgi:hypothetical protein